MIFRKGHNKNRRFLSIPNKLGQMEIIGLVVIVILISLGMIFLMIFALNSTERQKSPVHKDIAKSSMAALLEMTISDPSCYAPGTRPDLQVPLSFGREILEDCVSARNDVYSCNDGQNSCAFFIDTTREILDQTISTRGNRYEMRVWLIQDGQKNASTAFVDENSRWTLRNLDPDGALGGQGCPKNIRPQYSSGPFQLTILGEGRIETQLVVC